MLKSGRTKYLAGGGIYVQFKLDKKKYITIVVILVFLIFLIFCLCRSCEQSPSDNTSEPEKTLEFIPADERDSDNITIPGITGLNMKSKQLKQTVDFYNPDSNLCYFKISLYLSDDTLIYQSDYLKPSEHITEITLHQALRRGIYKNCRLVYQCYSLTDKSELNSGEIKLEINAQ